MDSVQERPGPTDVPARQKREKHLHLLPASFSPSPHTIICGRSKAVSTAPGNRRLKMIVTQDLKQYKETKNKLDKSAIVSRIVKMAKEAAAPDVAFVQLEQGQWWQVNDGVAHEKVGRMFRECLPTKYPSRLSSTKEFMLARRRRGRNAVKEYLNCSYDHSHTSVSAYVTPQGPTSIIAIQCPNVSKGSSMRKYADLLENYTQKRVASANKLRDAMPISNDIVQESSNLVGQDKIYGAFEQVVDHVGCEDQANIFSFVNAATSSTMEDCDITGLEGSTADLPDDISGIFSADDREEDDLISKVVD
jgi:hypothetical protein